MQSCSGYPHPNVVQHFEVLELPNKKGLEVRGIGQGCVGRNKNAAKTWKM